MEMRFSAFDCAHPVVLCKRFDMLNCALFDHKATIVPQLEERANLIYARCCKTTEFDHWATIAPLYNSE